MKDYKYSLATARGKKVWVRAYKGIKQEEFYLEDIIVIIELNIVDNNNKINYVIWRKGKENFIEPEELPAEHQENFIQKALEFAEANGHLERIKKKYMK